MSSQRWWDWGLKQTFHEKWKTFLFSSVLYFLYFQVPSPVIFASTWTPDSPRVEWTTTFRTPSGTISTSGLSPSPPGQFERNKPISKWRLSGKFIHHTVYIISKTFPKVFPQGEIEVGFVATKNKMVSRIFL